ncbi:GNAT domain-containing protein [Tuber borchii]|uniref:GNAT domain-containing protein n=1 Tax=Tuber borchii TaxID=42251 RepID=A0A2T6ZRF8_TUBBO|nr:GNAT domain-containing protein [Tuber borchii]
MKLNAKTALLSPKILLVPYEPHHVPTYHSWMEDEDLRTATASDRLTLLEEHAMQKSWREDGDKLTFIACLPPSSSSSIAKAVRAGKDDASECMLGDVNLFLYPSPEHNEAEGKVVAEVEVMIARREFHGMGLGREIVRLFLWYLFWGGGVGPGG